MGELIAKQRICEKQFASKQGRLPAADNSTVAEGNLPSIPPLLEDTRESYHQCHAIVQQLQWHMALGFKQTIKILAKYCGKVDFVNQQPDADARYGCASVFWHLSIQLDWCIVQRVYRCGQQRRQWQTRLKMGLMRTAATGTAVRSNSSSAIAGPCSGFRS